MAQLLTAASTLMCPHGGSVSAVTAGPRPSAEAPILLVSDTYTVSGCSFTLPSGVPDPCVMVVWISPDVMTSASAGPSLSISSTGLCISALGAPAGAPMVVATQAMVTGS